LNLVTKIQRVPPFSGKLLNDTIVSEASMSLLLFLYLSIQALLGWLQEPLISWKTIEDDMGCANEASIFEKVLILSHSNWVYR